MRFITRSLRYPIQARRKGIEGKVLIQFYIERDGSVSEILLLEGIGRGCDEEAMWVVDECPKWTLGIQRGQHVRVRMTLPIIFKLG